MIFELYAIQDRFGAWQAPMIFRDEDEAKSQLKKFFTDQKVDKASVKGSFLYRLGTFNILAVDQPIRLDDQLIGERLVCDICEEFGDLIHE